jgi:hypothetical protein
MIRAIQIQQAPSIFPAIPSNRDKLIDSWGEVGEIGSAPGIVSPRHVLCAVELATQAKGTRAVGGAVRAFLHALHVRWLHNSVVGGWAVWQS